MAQVPTYVPTGSLLAWYPFSGNANDISGNAHHGTVNGATPATDRFGNSASAYNFGNNMYISVADNSVNLRPQNMSVSLWVSFSVAPSAQYYVPISKNSGLGSGGSESMIVFWYNGVTGWAANTGSVGIQNSYITTPSQSVVPDTWIHLVYAYDDVNNTQYLYVNGVISTSAIVNGSIQYDADIWTIGNQYDLGTMQWWFPGKIDDIGIWGRALNQSEAMALYCAGSPSLQTQPLSQTLTPGNSATLTAIGSGTCTYQWQLNSGGGFNNLSNGGQYNGVTTSSLTVSNITLVNNGYLYRCIVTSSPCVSSSNIATLTVTSGSGLSEQSLWNNARLFPNPALDYITIHASAEPATPINYEIVDVLGKKLLNGIIHSKQNTISINGISAGLYFLKIEGVQKKFVKE